MLSHPLATAPRGPAMMVLHAALAPKDQGDSARVPPASAPFRPPTVKSQLDYFAGTWAVRGLPQRPLLESVWRGDWLFATHPATSDGRRARFADTFSYDDAAYVRYDLNPHPRPMFVSGGWLGSRWEWQRVDGSERITYDKLDADTMLVTEEARTPGGEEGDYKVVRLFEAQRSV